MVPWGCLCHTTTVMTDVEFQQYTDAVSCQALPRAPWRGWVFMPNILPLPVPRMLQQGSIRWRRLSKSPGRAEPARGEESTSSITIAPAWAVSHPHTHCKCQERPNFNKTCWLHLYLCSEARHKWATKTCTKLCKRPCGSSSEGVLCFESLFWFSKQYFSFNNKENVVSVVWLFFIMPPCEFCPYVIWPVRKGGVLFSRFLILWRFATRSFMSCLGELSCKWQ